MPVQVVNQEAVFRSAEEIDIVIIHAQSSKGMATR